MRVSNQRPSSQTRPTRPTLTRICLSALAWALLTTCIQAQTQPWFLFDQADEMVAAKMLEKPLFYDSGIAWSKEGLWIAWLEFEPGKGDQMWVELRGREGSKTRLTSTAGDYANPTPTIDGSGNLWVSYEAADSRGEWNVFVRPRQ